MKCVVVLWSRASVESDFVVDEAEDGKNRGVLVQAIIERVLPPHGFRGIQFADLVDWGGSVQSNDFLSLRRGVSRYVNGPVEGVPATGSVATVERADTPPISESPASPGRLVEMAWSSEQEGELGINVTNVSSQFMHGAEVTVTNLRWWDESARRFVESPDSELAAALPMVLGRAKIRREGTVRFAFLKWSSGSAPLVCCQDAKTERQRLFGTRITVAGRWSVGLRFTSRFGSQDTGLEFSWNGSGPAVIR